MLYTVIRWLFYGCLMGGSLAGFNAWQNIPGFVLGVLMVPIGSLLLVLTHRPTARWQPIWVRPDYYRNDFVSNMHFFGFAMFLTEAGLNWLTFFGVTGPFNDLWVVLALGDGCVLALTMFVAMPLLWPAPILATIPAKISR